MTKIGFFTAYLHTYCDNGNDILKALDDIISGEVRYLGDDDFWQLGSLKLYWGQLN